MCAEFKKNCMDPGGFAELIRVMEPSATSGVKKIPDSASFIMGSLIEPLGCCVRSVERSGMQTGDSVLVVGTGQVGSYHILTALALGAGKVLACDISKERLKAAQKIGAHSIINVSDGDPVDAVFDECRGGVDVAFVTSESPQAVATAVSAIREGGTAVLFAHGDGSATFDVNWILKGERTITASYSSTPGNHEKALELMLEGKLGVDCIETVSFALEEADEAVEAARTGKALRVILSTEARYG